MKQHLPFARTILRRHHAVNVGVLLLLAAAGSATAADSEKKPDKTKSDAPAHTVKKGALKSTVLLDAVFEAADMSPIRIQTKATAEITVIEAVAHGARVKQGDVLVKTETDKLREQIEELEQDRPAAVLSLELAEAELSNLTQTTPGKQESSKRAQRVATEDLAYFETIGRPSREKSAAFSLKGSEQRLEGAREELKQLKKMYDADDLTEESEEIILKRQKFAVESSEFFHESARQQTDLTLKTTLPRESETLKSAKRDQDMAFAYAEETLSRTLAKKRLDMEKLKRDQKKSEKRLAELKKDMEELTITAPTDGLVYYGACEDGKWTTGAAVAKRLVAGGKLAPKEVVMTLVNPDKLVLRATVPEADIAKLKAGQDAHAVPVVAPKSKIPVKLESLGSIPMPGGGFEARLSVGKANGVRVVPGMNCKINIEGARVDDVLVLPKEMVFGEATDRFVYVANRNGPEKRSIKLGSSDDKHFEITDGLAAGDKVLTKKPE